MELRLDRMADATVAALTWAAHALGGAHRIIVTYRSLQEGGGLEGQALHDAVHQRALLHHAVALGVGYVDVELATLAQHAQLLELLRWPKVRGARPSLVASFHAKEQTPPSELSALAAHAAQAGACAFKAVMPATCDSAAHGALAAWGHGPQPLPVLPLIMGPEGLWSRLLVGRQLHPAPYTLVRPDTGDAASAVAAGQPAWSDAAELYRVPFVHRGTRVFGVVGHPVGHSCSPVLHRRAIAARGLEAVYLPFDVVGPLGPWLTQMADVLGVEGLSVTAPHKAGACNVATVVSPGARAAGAVNTLVRAAGKARWHGHNTDGAAAADCLEAERRGSIVGAHVLVLGTGGAAQGVAWALAARGARVLVWGRNGHRASMLCQALAAQLTSAQGNVCAVATDGLEDALPQCDAVVHCTPVGMEGTAKGTAARLLSDGQLGLLPASAVVFDTVYAPAQTALMAAAARCGLTVLPGLAMLERQAEGQYALFYGPQPVP